MRRVVYFMIVFAAAVVSRSAFVSQARAQDNASSQSVTFTLGSYNCENFFDDKNDPYTRDETTRPKPESQLEELAKVMHAADADFLGVVEMESEGALYAFNKQRLGDLKYTSTYVDHRDWGRGINNGCLTRLPIYSTTLYRFNDLTLPNDDRHWTFARDPVCFDLRPAKGVDVQVFVVHLKSKYDSKGDKNSNHWRLAEATELRKIIAEKVAKDPNALIVVCGDFNDTPDSPPIQELLRADPNSAPVLVDVMAKLPADQRITYLKAPYRSTIDYIMASPAMAKCYVPGSAKVVNVPNQLEASDHAPVTAKFTVPLPVAGQSVR